MIKLKNLLTEVVYPHDWKNAVKRAVQESGKRMMIPSSTKKHATSVRRLGINRKIDEVWLMYAYINGWGGPFKKPTDYMHQKKDKFLETFYTKSWNLLNDQYTSQKVNSDIMTSQIVMDLYKGQKDVEPAYYLTKTYFNAFGMRRNSMFDAVHKKVSDWMKVNKIETH